MDDPLYDEGMEVRRSVLGDAHVDRAIDATSAFTAPFQDFITRYAWEPCWARAGLDRRTRSFVTLPRSSRQPPGRARDPRARGAAQRPLRGEIGEALLHSRSTAGCRPRTAPLRSPTRPWPNCAATGRARTRRSRDERRAGQPGTADRRELDGRGVGAEFEQRFRTPATTSGRPPPPARGRAGRRRRGRRSVPGVVAAAPASARAAHKAADLLIERAEIAGIVTEETGGMFGWGMFNFELAAGMLREAAAQTYGVRRGDPLRRPRHARDGGARARRRRRRDRAVERAGDPRHARGRDAARVGNTVVLKASELCPRTHAASSGARRRRPAARRHQPRHQRPADAEDVVDELIAHPATRRDQLHGLDRVGRIIAEKAGAPPQACPARARRQGPAGCPRRRRPRRRRRGRSFGAFFHQGQICMSTERIVVDDAVADSFAERLGRAGAALTVGDPRDPATQIGPLINARRRRARGRAGRGCRRAGRRVLTGGEPDGPCYPPTVSRRHAGDAHLRGGVIRAAGRVVSVDGPDDAVRVANDTDYGLSAAVFGRTCRRRWTWRSGSRAASATSTARPCTTSRRCRSAA